LKSMMRKERFLNFLIAIMVDWLKPERDGVYVLTFHEVEK
jgi:hypothetical protein